MKRILFILLFSTFCSVSAQNNQEKITLRFSDSSLKDVLFEIEEKTDFKFFFLERWLPNKMITENFEEVHVEEVLNKIFEGTVLNYYFLEDRIILTRNNIIYDELPEGFLRKEETTIVAEPEEESSNYNPVFHRDEEVQEVKEIETVYIGRAEKSRRSSRFSLSGIVRSAETGDPIPNLVISVQDRELGTVTNQRGYYEIMLPAGANLIETSSLGNEDVVKRIIIFNDGQLNLQLKEDFEQLGEILLESDPDVNVKSADTGTEEIEVEEIKNIPLVLGERDILKVAATLPGISTAGEGAAGFNVRGGRTDQNLILLDNAVVYNPAHFFGIFSALNPYTTGAVEIYKGNIPAEYGGRLSSVFDLETKQANLEEFSGEVSLGPVTANVALEIPVIKETSGLLLGVRSTYSDWILRSLEEESLQDSEATFYDGIIKYNHRLGENTNLNTTGYYSRDRFSITSDSIYDYTNRLFSLQLDHNFNDNNRGSLVLTNSNYKFNIDYSSEFNSDFRSGYKIDETGAKLLMRTKLNPTHTLQYGLSSKLYVVDPGEIQPVGDSTIESLIIPEEKGLESAVFISDDFEVSEKFLVSAGLRYSVFTALGEGIEKVYQENTPRRKSSVIDTLHFGDYEPIETYAGPEVRLSARYSILPDLSVKASYNTSRQYIHTLSNNTTASPTDTYKLSNGIIEPQTAAQYSLGLYKNLNNNIYELSLEGYYKTSNNLVDYKVGADLFLNEDIETEILQGKGRAYGAEFLLKKTSGALNGWIGYSYSRSLVELDGEFREEVVNSGEYFPSNFDKPHDLSVVANYKFTRRFSLSANFVYQTGRPVTYPIGKYVYNGAEYVLYSDRNEFRIPDYYRLDLSFNVEGNHKIKKFAHSFWNISVYNVLGRNNPYSVFFVTEDGEIQAYKSSIFSVPVPTITYNFKF